MTKNNKRKWKANKLLEVNKSGIHVADSNKLGKQDMVGMSNVKINKPW